MECEAAASKPLQRIVPDPGEGQYGGDDDDAAHGVFPALFPEYVHGKQIEGQCDHYAGAFAKIWRESFAAGAAQHGEYFEDVENQNGANGWKHQAKHHAYPDFVTLVHNESIGGCRNSMIVVIQVRPVHRVDSAQKSGGFVLKQTLRKSIKAYDFRTDKIPAGIVVFRSGRLPYAIASRGGIYSHSVV